MQKIICFDKIISRRGICLMKKILLTICVISITSLNCLADNVWINDLRNLFLTNNAIIYAINMRTFGAQDVNKDGIIDEQGEESGNFLNAISRLDELQALGINTLHVLPIMELGKTKALGSAGSLYAPSSFNKLNPQLKSQRSALSLEEQAVKFINEAHKRGIRVMVDLPACGSYDLYMKRPELFVKDTSGQAIIPADWTDVRLFNSGNENSINPSVYNLYKEYVDYVIKLGVDGIRADVAHSKPALFWKELIDYSRRKDPQFMWLAESSDSWNTAVSPYAVYTPYDKLLQSGFDGFYGSYFNMKDWRKAEELLNHVKFTTLAKSKFAQPKSVIGSFSTHDELSPVLINGLAYSDMILWLNATLPLNAYYVDGFTTGDNYVYLWGNKKARKSFTDDEYYFTHRGKLDIFNFSRQPGGKYTNFKSNFAVANRFKRANSDVFANGKFTSLKSSNSSVFAYTLSYNHKSILVFGNMDYKKHNEATIKVPGFNDENLTIPIKIITPPSAEKNKISVKLTPGEIQVLLIDGLEIK